MEVMTMMFRNGWHKLGWEWEPWQEMRTLRQQMNRLLEGPVFGTEREYPPVNVWQTEDRVVVTAELPGLEAKDLDLSVNGDSLTIRGTRPEETLKEGETYHRQERGSGNFVRSLQLPFEADAGKVDANLKNGVLSIKLERAEALKPKKIAVKSE
jgi:HSP20 family protein